MIIKVPNPIFGFHLGKVKNIKRPEKWNIMDLEFETCT